MVISILPLKKYQRIDMNIAWYKQKSKKYTSLKSSDKAYVIRFDLGQSLSVRLQIDRLKEFDYSFKKNFKHMTIAQKKWRRNAYAKISKVVWLRQLQLSRRHGRSNRIDRQVS